MITNIVGNKILNYLRTRGENIVAIYPAEEGKSITKEMIEEDNPDVIIICYWPYLLPKEIIDIPKYGCINFHPSLLPKNRGWYPAVWEVMEGDDAAGVTLHLIDEGTDTGPILAQATFPIKEEDTGGSVYEKSQKAMILLFKNIWEQLHERGVALKEQDHSTATYHSKSATNVSDKIDLNKEYKAGDLFRLIKAKTFKDKSYAYYKKDGDLYRVKIEVTKE